VNTVQGTTNSSKACRRPRMEKSMKYDYDIIVIGLGPAGMAVSIMGSEMGLSVCAIEKNKIGGECMNVGCIPSKSLLRMAKTRGLFDKLAAMELEEVSKPQIKDPFGRIRNYIKFINEKKTSGMFKKVNLILGQGHARFVGTNTVEAGGKEFSARKIFVATGTEPAVPPIPGIQDIDILTNANVFDLERLPKSMTIIGGGAIGCELAQAFTKLGTKCTIVQMDPHLIPVGDSQAGELLEEIFKKEGITFHNSKKIKEVEKREGGVVLRTEDGIEVVSESLFVGAGRKIDLSSLQLEKASVQYGKRGIEINKYLQTNQKHVFAVGDCNGRFLLTHAAMHQGMIGLMNAMMPWPFKQAFDEFVVPWTVFTDPPVSYVGMKEVELKKRGIKYETIIAKYDDYGAAIAENVGVGFVKVFTNTLGKIFGVSIVGEGSGEMINEWALAIQKKMRLKDIMFLQHSFPTMGFLTKRTSEMWMMNRMKSEHLKNICRFMFRL